MNAFGLSLVWVSLQVSVLCLLAMAVYLIARRRARIRTAAPSDQINHHQNKNHLGEIV